AVVRGGAPRAEEDHDSCTVVTNATRANDLHVLKYVRRCDRLDVDTGRWSRASRVVPHAVDVAEVADVHNREALPTIVVAPAADQGDIHGGRRIAADIKAIAATRRRFKTLDRDIRCLADIDAVTLLAGCVVV